MLVWKEELKGRKKSCRRELQLGEGAISSHRNLVLRWPLCYRDVDLIDKIRWFADYVSEI